MNSLVKDLSKLTTIPENKLENLTNISIYCITEEVTETLLQDKNILEYDIGLGKLYIKLDTDGIKYRFIPSQKLEQAVISSSKSKQNSLCTKIEKNLVDSIVNTYKDII